MRNCRLAVALFEELASLLNDKGVSNDACDKREEIAWALLLQIT